MGVFGLFFIMSRLGAIMGFWETGILTTVRYIIEMNYLDAPLPPRELYFLPGYEVDFSECVGFIQQVRGGGHTSTYVV